MPLPISIVVPRVNESDAVYLQYCLPSIRDNDPVEIITEEGEGDICAKRKAGALKATQPYLMFVDENVLLYEWVLGKMMRTLDEIKDIAFVYSDCRVFTGKSSGPRKSKPWDAETIHALNYVGIATLMRREAFPLNVNLQDPGGKDIWTAMAVAGHRGLYIGEVLFEIHEDRLSMKGVPDAR